MTTQASTGVSEMSVDSAALRPIYGCLVEAQVEFVVVGDQAVHLWAEAYAQTLPAGGEQWRRVRNSRREVSWDGLRLLVQHPLFALRGKLACLWGLDQDSPKRQDLKHVQLLCAILPAFLWDEFRADQRAGVALSRGVLQLACEEDALKAWQQCRSN